MRKNVQCDTLWEIVGIYFCDMAIFGNQIRGFFFYGDI